MAHEMTWFAVPDAASHSEARLERVLARLKTALRHDLHNQLVALQGLARDLKRDLVEGVTAPSGEYLDLLADLARKADVRLLTLADVLRFYREPEPAVLVRLDDVVREAAREVIDLFPERIIEYDLQVSMPAVRVPHLALRRAVFQLLVNAVEATAAGNVPVVRVTAEATEPPTLHIADAGRGLSATEVNRLFQVFTAATPTGPGLGLFLVREAVSLWGGGIRVHSEPGQGSTLSLLFAPPAPESH